MERTTITPTPQQLRALTHPVRLRMLGLLRVEGPATATTLATRLGLNTGATSYHLRQLATHGFITDDDRRGNGRERWWKAAHFSTTTHRVDPGSSDAAQSHDAYLQTVVTVMTETLQRAVEEQALLPSAWGQASTFSDVIPRLGPAKARALVERLMTELTSLEDDDDPEARPFMVQLSAFPYPGSVDVAAEVDPS